MRLICHCFFCYWRCSLFHDVIESVKLKKLQNIYIENKAIFTHLKISAWFDITFLKVRTLFKFIIVICIQNFAFLKFLNDSPSTFFYSFNYDATTRKIRTQIRVEKIIIIVFSSSPSFCPPIYSCGLYLPCLFFRCRNGYPSQANWFCYLGPDRRDYKIYFLNI